ncbi:MAG: acyl dehydratase [Gammaproteobacteria bacterium]|uniref:Acyl dehydratase n=1 Tax=OM182 bacterium MED-G28 TaxID=1986256 RepID=A0A2A5WEM0_9GAMM|nr:acyl dehydratase [Gammaproteobacteria bacterium]PDH34718.1 MAG: acyl dehydratase [OM182 bacterium MED-G28]
MFFEDFEVGTTEEFGEYLVTEEEILEFASKYDPQAFHLSDEAAKATLFGGLCASGWHTCAIAMRMLVDNMPESNKSLGSPGIDELRWTKPVFPGDTLRVKTTVLSKTNSRSRPDLGSLQMQNEVFNQKNELVMSNKPIVIYRKRDIG